MARGSNGSDLTGELARLLEKVLLPDLRERAARSGVARALDTRYQAERRASRTAEPFDAWRDRLLEQVGAAWILSCLFIRTLEDRGLLERRRIAGEGASDSEQLFFELAPNLTARDYLLTVFRELARFPGVEDVLGPKHNLAWRLSPSNDGARALLDFFRATDDAGQVRRTFAGSNTRFLGDIYQGLSKSAREHFALFQTPMFVADFLLDHTLEPAIHEFGLSEVRLIDPTCGSGHLLLDAFDRLVEHRLRAMPGRDPKDHAREALAQIHGVDVNPYAVAIARFRLALAFLDKAGIRKLAQSPRLPLNLVVADSLLHGVRGESGRLSQVTADARGWGDELFELEDPAEARRILDQRYHVVVGNPPYITVKDKAQNETYRKLYGSCHRQYSLAVPFMERFFDLALLGSSPVATSGHGGGQEGAGYVGMITANSFMKREFGKKLIEEYIPRWDLTHVIDTSGAYIPGHGTPTVILFGRTRRPVAPAIRAVMGIRGEPQTPEDPARGLVWSAILVQLDQPGSQSEFVSVADTARDSFHKHPWSIGGGGAAELKELLDEGGEKTLSEVCEEIGFGAVTREDEVYLVGAPVAARHRVPAEQVRSLVAGEEIRDWAIHDPTGALWPYDSGTLEPSGPVGLQRFLWLWRAQLSRRVAYGLTQLERELRWYEYSMFFRDRFRTPLSIAFAFVATHNHFVLGRGGKVFNRSAPVIKLPADATEDDHLVLLGLLNSSVACFWMKQVFYPKGGDQVGNEGARIRKTWWDERYEFDGTKMKRLPLPAQRPRSLAVALDALARELSGASPQLAVLQAASLDTSRDRALDLRAQMIALQEELDWECYRLYGLLDEDGNGTLTPTLSRGDGTVDFLELTDIERKISSPALLAGEDEGEGTILTDSLRNLRSNARFEDSEPSPQPSPAGDAGEGKISSGAVGPQRSEPGRSTVPDAGEGGALPCLQLGERAFEIVMARRMAAGELETQWFERHGSTPITEVPVHWPEDYRRVVNRRIAMIESNPYIRLIEQPEYKRRWNSEPWEEQQERALRNWLLDRLEDPRHWPAVELTSCARLSDRVRQDSDFVQVAELYTGSADFDVAALVTELVESEAVPFLPFLRYKPSGLAKREVWEQTWELQRREDALRDGAPNTGASSGRADLTGEIPVPPKYASADFLGSTFWRLRGKLDVPKERFISYPGAEGDDDRSLVIGWAGCDHLQQAQALAALYQQRRTVDDWERERLAPLLAGLLELLPWLKQWHNEPNPDFEGERLGNYFERLVDGEARSLGLSTDDLRNWRPARKAGTRGRGRKKASGFGLQASGPKLGA